MLYAEAAYFDGDHCAHVAAREEHRRVQRIAREALAAHRRRHVHIAAMWGRARG